MNETIGVCGAGTMGSGIAQVMAQSGYYTVLYDVDEKMIISAKENISKNLQYLVDKNKISPDEKRNIISRINFTVQKSDCKASIIIEAIIERTDAKVLLFNELAKINDVFTIFASNTSSLSITKIQEQIVYPFRVAGLHFFNPPYILKLVEIVKGTYTSQHTMDRLERLCKNAGKVPVVCKDAPGFIVNRVARPYYLESLKIAELGIASYADIDRILESSGFKMGPFKLMDLIGMDINLAVSESLYEAFDHEPRFKPSSLQKEKVKNNQLGRKTGEGFYNYQ